MENNVELCRCAKCGVYAKDLVEFQCWEEEGYDSLSEAISDDGSYNPTTNQFVCDECYIRIGTPNRAKLKTITAIKFKEA